MRTRVSALLLTCIAVALVLAFGATAGGAGEQAARPRTLATVRGSVDALAQAGRRIAWITTHARCGRQVLILTLPGRRPVHVGSRRGRSCAKPRGVLGRGLLPAIALSADGRVLWQVLSGASPTELAFDLFTAALRSPQTRLVATLDSDLNQGDPDHYQFDGPHAWLTAAGGNAVLFYARCDLGCNPDYEGAVFRLAGRRARRLVEVTNPVGLALSGRRFAVVTKSFHCCNVTPAWSHNGRRLAWSYHGNLWTVNADGTGDRQLAAQGRPAGPGSESATAPRPSWSPDDARLVFERAEANGHQGVYRVDASGGGLKRLAAGTSPAWSPDGKRIAFERGKDVYAIDPDGSGERKLTTTALSNGGPLSWSPDSTRIALSRDGDIYSVRADETGETRLTTSPHTEDQPSWSPDGTRVAYVDESGASRGIVAVNADGTGATDLTKAFGDSSPAWSPDSKRIAFVRQGRDRDQGVLSVMNADGSAQRRLLPPRQIVDSPQWAPDGSSIVVGDNLNNEASTDWPAASAIRLVSPVDGKATKIAPVRRFTVEIRDVGSGRSINGFAIDGVSPIPAPNRSGGTAGAGASSAAALGPDYVALLVERHGGSRLELYNLNGSLRRAAAVPAGARNLSASDGSVVFATGRVIRRLDAKTGVLSVLATARGTPVGPTIEGRRIVWAENIRGGARIRTVILP